MGEPSRTETFGTQTPGQSQYLEQIMGMLNQLGPDVSRYFQDLFSDDPEALERMFAPARREFEERTVPGIAERFTGMGAGAQSSSAFQQALGSAGAGLSENLAAMREQLRGQGISALQGFGQTGLGTKAFETAFIPRQPGFLESLAGPVSQAALSMAGAYAGQPQLGAMMQGGQGKLPEGYMSNPAFGRSFAG